MFKLSYDKQYPPIYMSEHSSGADLRARDEAVIAPSAWSAVGTGVHIVSVDWRRVPDWCVPEIVLKARSGLAFRHGITLLNGVGTVDADYRDEIKVLLLNVSDREYIVRTGDRIAQMVVYLSYRLPVLHSDELRQGGFGSTDLS